MALVVASAPAMSAFMSAYNPIPFVIYANQPSTADPCPVVYADVYFNNTYYGTFSATVYHAIVGPYAEYHFDIQDKCQEYLRSTLIVEPATTNNGVAYQHSAACYVKFRETDIDVDGFTVSVGTAPIQGTFFEDAVAGDGALSDTFYVLNTHLKQIDSYELIKHLKKYTLSYYIGLGYDYGWMLSHRPNEEPAWSALIGGGKYYICPKDIDIMTFCTEEDLDAVGAYIDVAITYLDGSSFTDTIAFSAMPVPYPASDLNNITYYLNAGIPNLSTLLGSMVWTNIYKYTVYIYAPFQDFATQTYYVKNDGCCKQRIRILFVNLLGGYDGINFNLNEEISKTYSSEYQKSKSYVDLNKKDRGIGRFQPKQTDFIECWTEDYVEADMPWINELLGTSQAYIQVVEDDVQDEHSQLHPIVILDSEIVTKKKDDAFVYNVSVKFKHSNEVINLRS